MNPRIGHGYDVHKLGGPGPLMIGGGSMEYQQGLLAHSDGDVALHALCDALLGAVALGDIGQHFPDTDAQFKGIDSRQLLRQVCQLVMGQGYQLANLDLTIVAQAPKMAPHSALMRECIAEDLDDQLSQINVKATTTEQLGFTGRKEGIACYAVVLLNSITGQNAKVHD